MARSPNGFELMTVGWKMCQLMVETQVVISLRLLGIAGFWSVTPHENTRMMTEKSPAFAKSAGAITAATIKGKRPDQIMTAGIAPLSRKASANSRRLMKRGPK